MNRRIAIFPGSFDPYTAGHHELAIRGSLIFDELIIAIGVNSSKERTFKTEQMFEKLSDLYRTNSKINIETYDGLTSDFAEEKKANFILRGLRNSNDLNYEVPIAQANTYINKKLESVFLISDPKHTFISSSIVRDLYKHGQDVSNLLPYDL